MTKHIRVLGTLFALLLSFSLVGTGYAQTTQGCDTSGNRNGNSTPTAGTPGTTIIFQATGFQQGESVSYWFTLPNGQVSGAPIPIRGSVNPDGSIGPLPFTLTADDVAVGTGRRAITFHGATSNNEAIIFYCVYSAAQVTATASATTATSVPVPDVTSTATAAIVAATVLPTGTIAPAPTTAPAPTVEATPTASVIVIVGVPRTGQPYMKPLAALMLAAMALVIVGGIALRFGTKAR